MAPPADGKVLKWPAKILPKALRRAQKKPVAEKTRPGWQVAIIGGISVTAFSLLCNVILLIVGAARYDSSSKRGKLLTGSCATVPSVDTGLHVFINILSALLLGASNAAMQCLSAPTRAELDRLHAQGQSADIGLNGFRNLKVMTRLRRTLWVLLLCSSVPLHLLYNSVIVSTVASWNWTGFLVTNDFVLGAGHPGADWNHQAINWSTIADAKLEDLQNRASTNQLERLDAASCLSTFSALPIYGYSNVLLVVNQVPEETPANSGSVLGIYHRADIAVVDTLQEFYNITFALEHSAQAAAEAYRDLIADTNPNNTHQVLAQGARTQFIPSSWPLFWNNTPIQRYNSNLAPITDSNDAPPPDFSFVDHCLAMPVDDFCSVDTLPIVQAVVVILNSVKLMCLVIMLRRVKEQPLVTLGDAMTSFLNDPDTSSKETGPINILRKGKSSATAPPNWMPTPKRHWWFRGVSPLRWGTASFICLSYLAVGILFSISGASSNPGNSFSFFNRFNPDSSIARAILEASPGRGTYDNSFGNTISLILFANSFQLILSIAYFHYNGVVTSMLLSREWTNFARYRKGLRVSTPQGSQRRTFWLSLPYAYNMPLLALASVLHWMMSETLFYQELFVLDGDRVVSETATGVLPSNLVIEPQDGVFMNTDAMTVLVIFAGSCLALVVGLGFRRYAGGIPLVRSNSLAIARACHERPDHPVDPTRRLAWGVRAPKMSGDEDIGFSSGDVELLDPSSLEFNAFDRMIRRWKKHSHARFSRMVRRATHFWQRPDPRRESLQVMLEHPQDVVLEGAQSKEGWAGSSQITLVDPDRGIEKHEWKTEALRI